MNLSSLRRGGFVATVATSLVAVIAVPAFAAVNFIVVTPSPNIGALHNELHSVAVGSSTVMFAVGESYNGTWDRALILQGNGTSWTASTAPQPPNATHNVLNSVTMAGATKGFAVGTYSLGRSSYNLIERFAANHWSRSSLSNPTGVTTSGLNGVAAGSATSVMAVGGSHGTLQAMKPISALFNGSIWKYYPVPNPGHIGTKSFTAELDGVSVVPGSLGKKFWAVGTYSNGSDTMPFFDMFNGLSWRQYKLIRSVQAVIAAPSPVSSVVSSVVVVAPNNAWAVGYYTANHTLPTPSNNRTFTAHWNGANWSMVVSPNRVSDSTPNELVSVAARSATKIYAVGRYFAGPYDQTQVLMWNTAVLPPAWTKLTSGNNTIQHNSLEGIAVLPVKGAISVGAYYSGTADRTLIESCFDC